MTECWEKTLGITVRSVMSQDTKQPHCVFRTQIDDRGVRADETASNSTQLRLSIVDAIQRKFIFELNRECKRGGTSTRSGNQ